jgi:hypothetical protein
MFPCNLRWLLVPIVSIGGCFATLAITDAIGLSAPQTDMLRSVQPFLATDVRTGIAFAAAAVVFVAAGTLVAPRYRSFTAIVLYGIGATAAWEVLRGWHFPERDPRGYEPSLVPLVLTLIGGLVAALAVIADDWRRKRVGRSA